jgi:hypothetical protein
VVEGEGTIAQGAVAAVPSRGSRVAMLASGRSDPSAVVVDDRGVHFNNVAGGGLIEKDREVTWPSTRTRHAGETPDVVHWNGSSWTVTVLDPSVSQNYLYAVWADAPDDVWAVGGGGAIIHLDGTAWAAVVTGNGANATRFSVWGSGRSDVWAAGASGTVLHWNGTAWTQQAGAGYDVNDVWGGLDDGQVWLVSLDNSLGLRPNPEFAPANSLAHRRNGTRCYLDGGALASAR